MLRELHVAANIQKTQITRSNRKKSVPGVRGGERTRSPKNESWCHKRHTRTRRHKTMDTEEKEVSLRTDETRDPSDSEKEDSDDEENEENYTVDDYPFAERLKHFLPN